MLDNANTEESLLLAADNFVFPVVDKFYPPDNEVLGDPLHWGNIPFRIFPGETSIWSGINGHGKSLFLNQLCLEQVVIGRKCCIASFEMPAVKTLYRMARQATGLVCPTTEELYLCMAWLGKRVYLYDKTGTGSIRELKKVFTRAISEYGVSFFVVDSLMKCGIDPKDFGAQKKFMDEWQDFAQIHDVNVNIVAHSRKTDSEEDRPGKMDVAGAMELTNLPDNVYSIWRNKKKESEIQKYHFRGCPLPEKIVTMNDCFVDCSKSREMGGDAEGMFGLYFDKASMQFVEKCGQAPYIYFEK